MLNIYQLSIFLAAAEAQGFTRAAQSLHLTPSAVNIQVRGLEKHLGLRLFQRKGLLMELTEAGRALLPAARQLVDLINQTEASILHLQDPAAGRLIIGCGSASGEWILPKLLGLFKGEYPDVQITVRLADAIATLRGLRDMEVDFGLLGLRPREKGLQSRKLLEDQMVLIVPAKHPWGRRAAVDPEDLRQANFILRDDGSGVHRQMMESLEKHGVAWEDLKIVMEVGGTGMVEWAVGAGLGVSLVSRLAARRYPGKIRVVEVNGLSFSFDLCLVKNTQRVAGYAGLKFWEFVQSPQAQELIAQEVSKA